MLVQLEIYFIFNLKFVQEESSSLLWLNHLNIKEFLLIDLIN